MNGIEQLFRPWFYGQPTAAMSHANVGPEPWVGRTTLDSGSVAVTVSTTLVSSGKTGIFTMTQPGSVGVSANSGGHIVVNSLVDGVSFAFARSTGVAAPWDETITWMAIKLG